MNLPDPIKNFVNHISKLPSIGPRQATRLSFFVINSGKKEIEDMKRSLEELEKMAICEKCYFVFLPKSDSDKICEICSDKKRNHKIIAVVEKETDLISLENTNKFNGVYFIIGNLQKNGVLGIEQKNRISKLKNIIQKELGGQAEEIIIAINPTTYGDFNALLLAKELKDFSKKITRLGKGIPTGGEIEFADEETLGSAIERRV
jgi:recombination protein RecR